jgi:hypothetical protein
MHIWIHVGTITVKILDGSNTPENSMLFIFTSTLSHNPDLLPITSFAFFKMSK